jgi:GMP synthase-like glutamine amidotransferase
MPGPRILVVQNDPDKSLGRITAHLEAAGATLDVRSPTSSLPSLDGYAGLIVLPGLADPIDDHPAVHEARATIVEALGRDLPILGLCLGAQLLAQATGGDVYRSANELGYGEVAATPAADDDALVGGVPERFLTFHAHRFAFTPPADATVLLENDVCVQAFRIGDRIWGFQCHPEIPVEWADGIADAIDDPTTVEGLAAATAEFFGSHGVTAEALRSDTRAAAPVAERLAHTIGSGFAAVCSTVSAGA